MSQPESEQEAMADHPNSAWRRWRHRLQSTRAWLVPRHPEYDPSPRRRAYLLAVYIGRRFVKEDRGSGMAAVVTIHTLLSTVPLIGVALLVVNLMDETSGARLIYELFGSLVPETERAQELTQGALDLARNVTLSNLGVWGFLVTLVIAFVLFQNLERTFNLIWRTTRRRHVIVKFTMFYTLATLGPLVMLFSLAQPFLPGVSRVLATPLVTSALALVALNRFLPATDVKWKGALVGGLVSAVFFEVFKYGFGVYATRFALQTYEGLYGSLAMMPIVIIWTYFSWFVVLIGAEIAYVVQHQRSISLMGYMNRYILDQLSIQRPSGRTAARVVLAICDHYHRRELGSTAEDLAGRFGVGLDTINEILGRLEIEGLLVEVEQPAEVVVPARPLDQIRVLDVIELFDRDHAGSARAERLGDVFEKLDALQAEAVGDTTFADLIEPPRVTSVTQAAAIRSITDVPRPETGRSNVPPSPT